MILYYSGARAFNAIQNNPDASLGGWMSSTSVPNDLLNNLFSSISERTQFEQLSEIKGIFIVNNTSIAISSLSIYSIQDVDDVVSFDFSVVAVANGQSMERIPSIRATPYYSDFFSANGVGNAEVIVDNLAPNGVVGLWIRRTAIKRADPPAVSDINNQNDPFNIWYNKLQNTLENPSIVLSWT